MPTPCPASPAIGARRTLRPGRATAACGAISISKALLGGVEALTDSFLEISASGRSVPEQNCELTIAILRVLGAHSAAATSPPHLIAGI